MNNYFGDTVYTLRKKARLSQRALGERLGVSDRAVSNWETGVAYPSTENLLRLASVLGVSPERFTGNGTAPGDAEKEVMGMESLRGVYRIGRGPSSSHTIAPETACRYFAGRYRDADRFRVVLHGSLAKTGKVHGIDEVIRKTLAPVETEIRFVYDDENLPHPNTMDYIAFRSDREIGRARIFSVGGGEIRVEGQTLPGDQLIYKLHTFSDIAAYCREKGIRLWQFVRENEDNDFHSSMERVWAQMKTSIRRGLEDEGTLPGGLGVKKKAKQLISIEHVDESAETRENRLVSAYAFAVGEQNASGETIVTAPTCGSAGVLPAVLYYQQQKRHYSDEEIIRALETAGLIGNLIRTNASISGAECGCQAEIGTACAMAAAALGELFELDIDKIEYAAEISIEHHLGLTCDPIGGLVQIPCIERGAVAAMRAVNAINIASFLSDTRRISLDNVIAVMKKTGLDISGRYKETAEAGLAMLRLK